MKFHHTFHKHAHHFCGFTYPDGNNKQGRMLSFSFDPQDTCPDDAPCKKSGMCYYIKEGKYYPSVAQSAKNNYDRYRQNPVKFWKSLDKAIVYCKKEKIGLRPFEGGDIPSYEFLCNLVEKAKTAPRLMHQMTKAYYLVNLYIYEHGGDKSCILDYIDLRFSKWDGYDMPNPYGMPVFERVMDEEHTTCLEQKFKMIGKEWACEDCYANHCGCYSKDHRSIYCIDHDVEQKIIRKRKLWRKKGD